jgi:hypothetical protein
MPHTLEARPVDRSLKFWSVVAAGTDPCRRVVVLVFLVIQVDGIMGSSTGAPA